MKKRKINILLGSLAIATILGVGLSHPTQVYAKEIPKSVLDTLDDNTKNNAEEYHGLNLIERTTNKLGFTSYNPYTIFAYNPKKFHKDDVSMDTKKGIYTYSGYYYYYANVRDYVDDSEVQSLEYEVMWPGNKYFRRFSDPEPALPDGLYSSVKSEANGDPTALYDSNDWCFFATKNTWAEKAHLTPDWRRNPDRPIERRQFYEKLCHADYKRKMSRPTITANSIIGEDTTLQEGDRFWIKPGRKFSIRTNFYQEIPHREGVGDSPTLSDYIYKTYVSIWNEDGSNRSALNYTDRYGNSLDGTGKNNFNGWLSKDGTSISDPYYSCDGMTNRGLYQVNTGVINDDNADYSIWKAAQSYNGLWTSGNWGNSTSQRVGVISTDGTAPTGHFDANIEGSTLKLRGHGISDARVGVKWGNVQYGIKRPWETNYHWKVAGDDKSGNAWLDYDLGDQYGDWDIVIWAEDRLGNNNRLDYKRVTREEPKPEGADGRIEEYKWEDPHTGIKWVNCRNGFKLHTWTWMRKGCKSYPTTLWDGLNYSDDDFWHDRGWKGVHKTNYYNAYGALGDIIRCVDKQTQGKSTAYDWEGKPTLDSNNWYLANSKYNNYKIPLKVLGGRFFNNRDNYSPLATPSNQTLGIDAKAPHLVGEPEFIEMYTPKVQVKDDETGIFKQGWLPYKFTGDPYSINMEKDTVGFCKGDDCNVEECRPRVLSTTENFGGFDSSEHQSKDGWATIVLEDYVGNRAAYPIELKGFKAQGKITHKVINENGRAYLQVNATGNATPKYSSATNCIIFSGTGDGLNKSSSPRFWGDKTVDFIARHEETLSSVIKVDDVYNTPEAPKQTYTNDEKRATVDWSPLDDIDKDYTFTLDDYRTSYFSTKSVYGFNKHFWPKHIYHLADDKATFKSGFDHYHYVITDEHGKVVKEGDTPTTTIDVSRLSNGKYTSKVRMYDKNGNPSGEGSFNFEHHVPFMILPMEGEVTAVKDLRWKDADYPYYFVKDKDKFPLGLSYTWKKNGIQMGYGVNFTLNGEKVQRATKVVVNYTFVDSHANPLKITKDGKTLEEIDRAEGTHFTTQTFLPKDYQNNKQIYAYSFLPVSESVEVRDKNGAKYRGDVIVNCKVSYYLGDLKSDNNMPLFSSSTETSALGDLHSNRQR
ncbi:MAG: hypothetical protein E7H54_04580 [Clostridium perfringens]|nr:hypothetical protein [Clostridium perfringens]